MGCNRLLYQQLSGSCWAVDCNACVEQTAAIT